MFIFHSRYLKPLEEVDQHLADHRSYLKSLAEKKQLLCSGPRIPREGGVVIINAPGKQEALQIMKGDPYVISGVAEYSLIEFELKTCVEGFRDLL